MVSSLMPDDSGRLPDDFRTAVRDGFRTTPGRLIPLYVLSRTYRATAWGVLSRPGVVLPVVAREK